MSFKKSLARGALGEWVFYQAHEGQLIKEDGRARDFTLSMTGEGVELKSDFYPFESTPYFFFERYSNEAAGSPGGPWQTLQHGNRWFVYMFVHGLECFRFETEALVKELEGLIPALTPCSIHNKNYTTVGYKVPRDALSHLYKHYSLKVSISYDE